MLTDEHYADAKSGFVNTCTSNIHVLIYQVLLAAIRLKQAGVLTVMPHQPMLACSYSSPQQFSNVACFGQQRTMAKHISSYVAKPVGIAPCVMQFVFSHNTTCSMTHILSRSYIKAIALEFKASQSSIQFGLIIRHTHYAVKERMSSNSLPINLHVDPCIIWLAT